MDTNTPIKAEAFDLCYQQVEFWDRFIDYLIDIQNESEVDFAKDWEKYFQDNTDVTLKFAELNFKMEKIIEDNTNKI